ncbi:MAG TPA: hypothetical protein VHV55_24215 [Pirellulales bacterium]|nr:hypothetical protein [Pirellulales bacterium]
MGIWARGQHLRGRVPVDEVVSLAVAADGPLETGKRIARQQLSLHRVLKELLRVANSLMDRVRRQPLAGFTLGIAVLARVARLEPSLPIARFAGRDAGQRAVRTEVR